VPLSATNAIVLRAQIAQARTALLIERKTEAWLSAAWRFQAGACSSYASRNAHKPQLPLGIGVGLSPKYISHEVKVLLFCHISAQWVSRRAYPQLAVDSTQRKQIRPIK